MGHKRSHTALFTRLRVLVLLLLVGVNLPLTAQPASFALGAQTAAASSLQDTPVPLVPSGVNRYTLAAPKLFWQTRDCTPYIGANPDSTDESNSPNAGPVDSESISRIATYGSTVRTLYAASANGFCGALAHTAVSDIAADAEYVYWLTDQGLVRLSTGANIGDAPQVFSDAMAGAGYGDVAMGSDKVYVLKSTTANTHIWAVDKASGAADTILNTPDASGGNLSYDGKYIYFKVGSSLRRLTIGQSVQQIVPGVAGYYAEGARSFICGINPIKFCTSYNVYVGVGNKVFIYDNVNNLLGNAIYTSPVSDATISSLTTTNGFLTGKLLFFENRPQAGCTGFCSSTPVLIRTGRGGGTADPIYTGSLGASADTLTNDGTFVFWQESGALKRLPVDAAALPQTNMRITGMEVTQGIQNLSNSVLLIKQRRTFVRVYVKSDGPAVPGVTALLSSPNLGTLQPVNSVGTKLTVRPSPSRNDINQSFLFELPWSWTNVNALALTATLNPYKVPLQTNYSNNSASQGFLFKPSPKLTAEFFRLNYNIGGTTYRPRISADIVKTYSWIMRAYPIGGSVGQNFKPQLWDVDGSTRLGKWVNRSSGDCTKSKINADDLSLCASFYTNGWLNYYRTHAWVPNTKAFYYGMISDGSGNFPRGQAIYSKSSVGPSGTPCTPFGLGCGWDSDGSYADWYAGHEMGHSLGRAHPTPSAAPCGNSASDNNYPYTKGHIGPDDGSMEGFDVGDPSFGIAKAVYPGTTWNDVMSYCNNQWISDYTYTAMYNNMIANPSAAPLSIQSARPAVAGDFLQVSGAINAATSSAAFSLVQRVSDVADQPALVPGDYSIRLLDGASGVLATYAFTPEADPDGDLLGVNQVVDFVAGTRAVEIIRNSDSAVLGSYAVSANPPAISDVALQGAPDPVTGVVTLGWNASDPDGDALTFDIFYSRDNGATFQPVQMGATGTSTQIDTATLGGSGTAILRVVASDGTNTAEATSAPFVMAPKPPQPFILSPGATTNIHFGQLVNFNGMALDAQDNLVADAGLSWSSDKAGALGTGALVSSDSLPVGVNIITLTATNSVGESASATVTVIVDDDLDLPGPTLSAGPGQVDWQVAAGETAAQTAEISVTNAGGGTLDWTAASDQPWLTTDVVSGTISADGDPTTLTLSADPTGLAANAAHMATLTLTRPASGDVPAQTLVIPVSLTVGDTRNGPPPADAPPRGLYLPLMQR